MNPMVEAELAKRMPYLFRDHGSLVLGMILESCAEDRELDDRQVLLAAKWLLDNDADVFCRYVGPLFDAICWAAGETRYGPGGWNFDDEGDE